MAIVTIRDENGMTVFEEDFGDTLIREIILTVNPDNNDETMDLVVDLDMGRVGVYTNPDPETGECQDEVEVLEFPDLTNYMREY
jgi:hypothetical protein